MLAEHPEQGEHPDVALEPGQRATARPVGCGTVDAGQVTVEAVGGEPVAACHVADVDPHPVHGGLTEPEPLQPRGSA
jgi:hypothetical protein